ncbi:MAG: shikimate dehydrogenase [Lachnospiraceae bacterium]|nr:shikimate dehydrogenase [Lachnospiraceae bacterium]
MNINGKTKTCGLIGCPVEHTLSPIIHNTLAERMGQNLVYVPFHVEKENVESAVLGAYALSLGGMNVTVPHKSAVIPYLKEIDPLATKIGAVNTLVPVDGGYKGYNTDMTGLQRAMETEDIVIADKNVILLGAGGASRAVAFMLVSKGAKNVYLLNRSVDKAQAVAEEVNRAMDCQKVVPMAIADYKKLPKEKYLCIQGTSVGLHPNADAAVIEDPDFYQMVDVGVDLIYKPARTKFMKLCNTAGADAYNGLKMLLYQGIIAYELWNDVQVSDELADEIYEMMKEATKVEE